MTKAEREELLFNSGVLYGISWLLESEGAADGIQTVADAIKDLLKKDAAKPCCADEKPVVKNCSSCKHEKRDKYEVPCSSCWHGTGSDDRIVNWAAKEDA